MELVLDLLVQVASQHSNGVTVKSQSRMICANAFQAQNSACNIVIHQEYRRCRRVETKIKRASSAIYYQRDENKFWECKPAEL